MNTTPPLRGRARELGFLRSGYDSRKSAVRWVVGLPGVGKTEAVLRAASAFRFIYHRASPLSDPLQRRAFGETLRLFGDPGKEAVGGGPEGGAPARRAPARGMPAAGVPSGDESSPSWSDLFDAVVDRAPEGSPLVVVIDDAHRWVESRARFEAGLQAGLARADATERAVHITLVAPEIPSSRLAPESLLPPLHLRPLSFRAAWPFLPGRTAWDRLQSYTVFGGLPGILTLLNRKDALASNLRRLVLDRDAPLRDMPLTLLERYFQRPNRYAAILSALSGGEGDWGTVQAGVGDLTASGQAGPYLKRLEEVGLVESRRSLDASPRTRSRRYRVTDPFVAYWYRFILPRRETLGTDPTGGGNDTGLNTELASQVGSILPEVCRSYMIFDAMEELGANARECGSLWGPGYELPVAGVLANGVPFYGLVLEPGSRTGPSALGTLDRQVRETRYGFGRERRLRILFCGGKVSPDLLRAVARREDAILVPLENLAGVSD